MILLGLDAGAIAGATIAAGCVSLSPRRFPRLRRRSPRRRGTVSGPAVRRRPANSGWPVRALHALVAAFRRVAGAVTLRTVIRSALVALGVVAVCLGLTALALTT